jgi:hypothetical protein
VTLTKYPGVRSGLCTWTIPGLAVGLAATSVVALYLTGSPPGSDPRPASPMKARVTFQSEYPVEPSFEGRRWRWMRDSGRLVVRGEGRYWLAFRAMSLSEPRMLTARAADNSTGFRVRVSPRPEWHVIGPVDLAGRLSLRLTPDPPARQGPGRDSRRLSVYIASPRVSTANAFALPGENFWSREGEPGATGFRWLRQDGSVEIVASNPRAELAWLSVVAQSHRITRSLRITPEGPHQQTFKFSVAAGSRPRSFTVGPIRLRAGRAHATFSATPGPGKAAPGDARQISIRILGLTASTVTPETPSVP